MKTRWTIAWTRDENAAPGLLFGVYRNGLRVGNLHITNEHADWTFSPETKLPFSPETGLPSKSTQARLVKEARASSAIRSSNTMTNCNKDNIIADLIHIRTCIGRPDRRIMANLPKPSNSPTACSATQTSWDITISDARTMTLRGEKSFNGRELCPACCKKLGL